MKTIEDLKSINQGSIAKMKEIVEEIDDQIGDPNLSLADESRLISRRATLSAQINNQMLIQAHLKASKVTVEFTTKQESDLEKLNTTMDELVISGLKVNAILGLASKAVDTALAIGNAVTMHTGQSV